MTSSLKKTSFVDFLLFVSLIIIGGFNDFVSCFLSVGISLFLVCKIVKNKQLVIRYSLFNFSIALICIMYGLVAFWAIDSGVAFIGFLKFLPLILYLFALWQTEKTSFEGILPYFAAVLVCISVVAININYISDFFVVAGRLSGFFQYPNTFALFLLLCELMLVEKSRFKTWDYVCLVILIFGLLLTGSRTVFILAILSNTVFLGYKFRNGLKTKKFWIFLGLIVAICIVVFLLNRDILSRYLSISFGTSTFVGRILYWIDALPLLLKYPFGMGYLGYNYIQTAIQTGVYTVRYIHNDFLQMMLDIGWIPTAVFIVAIFKFLFNRKVSFYKKVLVGTICAHSFFDFNLQFISIFMLLLLLTDNQSDKKIFINKKIGVIVVSLMVVLIVNIYMCLHLSLSYFKQNKTAEFLYPWNTENKIAMLEKESDINYANEIADEILKQNQCSYIPYSVKAKFFYSKGDFSSLIENKNVVFEMNPFGYEEYEEYCRMLINGVYLYQRVCDEGSVKYCQQELINTNNKLLENSERLSYFGKRIKDQPEIELPKEILDYISKLEKE